MERFVRSELVLCGQENVSSFWLEIAFLLMEWFARGFPRSMFPASPENQCPSKWNLVLNCRPAV